jgi:hypothetical protein
MDMAIHVKCNGKIYCRACWMLKHPSLSRFQVPGFLAFPYLVNIPFIRALPLSVEAVIVSSYTVRIKDTASHIITPIRAGNYSIYLPET